MSTGLESSHAPLTSAFPPPSARDRYRLDEAQRDAFLRDGYLAPLDVLSPGEVTELRRRLSVLRDSLEEHTALLYEVEAAWRARPDEVVLHFLGGWRVDEWLHDLAFHPALTVPAAEVLGLEHLRFWHDQVFWKPPGHPGVVPWHQDYSYWTRTAPAGHVTVFLALDDCDAESGCLEVVPGSQRFRLLPTVDFGGPRDQILAHLSDAERRAFRTVPIPLRAGQASLHHSHTVHGSGPNRSAHPRRALALNFMDPETRSLSTDPLLAGTRSVPPGSVVEGPCFPLVL